MNKIKIGCICIVGILISCLHPSKNVNIHPLNLLFKTEEVNRVQYDYNLHPKELEQYLIEQVPLGLCDVYGNCSLIMEYLIGTDTVCFPTRLDRLFITSEDIPVFCGDFGHIIVLHINQNNQLLFEEKPMGINKLYDEFLKEIERNEEERRILIKINWHRFTGNQIKKEVFKQLFEALSVFL